MLSLEDRILSDMLVARNLVGRELLERRAAELDASPPGVSLADVLLQQGDLDAGVLEPLAREAGEIGRSLAPDLPPGRSLGEFTLEREIGRGGMGIVYEARQRSLGRTVAVKVLPAGAALDERLAVRFLREARVVSQLSHPGIVPVYASGRAEGVLYFAMELIAGRPLSEMIAAGPLDPRDAARIAAEVARALDHAHGAGLVHRDVKPENILVQPDGRARVTDFGLVREAEGASLTVSQCILGTPAYVPPEQARGETVDARADVYALGAVLYHALAGQPPYTGRVPAVVLGNVLASAPPRLASRRAGLPPAIVGICEKAMARDREARYPTAGALADDLEKFLRGETVEIGVTPGRRSRILRAAAAGVVLAAAGLAWWMLRLPPFSGPARPEAPALGVLIGTARRVPTPPGAKSYPALSPDGASVVYGAETAEGWPLHMQTVESPAAFEIAPGPATEPSFSPDGGRVAYSSGGRLVTLDLKTGESRPLADRGGYPTWSHDGTRVAFLDKSMHEGRRQYWPPDVYRMGVVDAGTGVSEVITSVGVAMPAWSPNGSRIALLSQRGGAIDIWTIAPDGGDLVRVTDDPHLDWSPAWSHDGRHLYFGSDRGGSPDLWRVAMDESNGRALGVPEPVTRGFMNGPFYLSAALRADRLVLQHWGAAESLWSLPYDPSSRAPAGPPARVTRTPSGEERSPDPAPDGSAVAFTYGAGNGRYVAVLRAGAITAITGGPHEDASPRWSPDGARVAFRSNRSGNGEIWIVDADGRNLGRLTDTAGRDAMAPVWSPDGRKIAYGVAGDGAYIQDLTGGQPERLADLPGAPEPFVPTSWSADGGTLAGTAGGIAVYSIRERTFRRLAPGGRSPAFAGDGADLIYVEGNSILALAGRSGEPRAIYSAGPNALGPEIAVSRDGRTIHFSAVSSQEEIWLLDLAGTRAGEVTE